MESELSKIGKNLIVGLKGSQLEDREKTLLRELKPLGIILFSKNIDKTSAKDWRETLSTLIKQAKEYSDNENLIVSIDHEGGRVHRFIDPVTRFKAAKNWQESSSSVAQIMAYELRELGFNLSFAPVLDIHSEESNPVIGERAFSATAEEVIRFGKEFYHGLESMGVLACAKHFPGHGATISDSHFELPKLDLEFELIFKRELLPFKSLIDEGISMIMTAHVLYPKLDSKNPATLSQNIIQGILREQLEYHKVVITDDLEMKALSYLSPAEKAVNILNVGVDILLEANPVDGGLALDVAWEMARGIAEGVSTNKLPGDLLELSQKRIDRLIAKIVSLSKLKTKELNFSADLIRILDSLIV